ncbi:4a-hydroxytetrahydrobiopterin dehydratase [Luteibaculum oceani]|uniref:4a-hydroxytetrahydrobiopterin dehydratase n=1 Tax=Luteibaculum oceani TaxID=1294296 RepID=A0A5C6V1Z9_9FLAO|nr:4a-hydroxytetrahydrobiopterin dehydratase [Luteibaculum oceani]TXC77045.1 4a-hydroxytetrahydrobiopterin dehydratase [Luteibaculum oceani]
MWQESNNRLERVIVYKNFSEALASIVQVGIIAEKHNHHPEIINVYNKVTLSLTTHDAGNIVTEKDWKLAEELDHVLPKE